jgi:hypothetical protein
VCKIDLHSAYLLPLLRACVNADAATLFWAAVDLGFDRTLLALDATDEDVFSLLFFDVAMQPPKWGGTTIESKLITISSATLSIATKYRAGNYTHLMFKFNKERPKKTGVLYSGNIR